jgi:hypothetical protein
LGDFTISTARKADGSHLWTVKINHAPHRRRLAGTIRTKKSGDPSWLHVKTEIVDRKRCSKSLGEPLNADH